MNAEQILAALRKRVNQTKQRLAAEIQANLIETTPVDTGWARANWRAGLNYPPLGTIGDEKHPPGALVSRDIAQAKYGDTIYITNNVPYIGRLDAGWSRQQPAGFVLRAIDNAIIKVAHQTGGVGAMVNAAISRTLSPKIPRAKFIKRKRKRR